MLRPIGATREKCLNFFLTLPRSSQIQKYFCVCLRSFDARCFTFFPQDEVKDRRCNLPQTAIVCQKPKISILYFIYLILTSHFLGLDQAFFHRLALAQACTHFLYIWYHFIALIINKPHHMQQVDRPRDQSVSIWMVVIYGKAVTCTTP